MFTEFNLFLCVHIFFILLILWQVGQPEVGEAKGNQVFSVNPDNAEDKSPTKQLDMDQQHHRSATLNFSTNNEKEKILNSSSAVDAPDIKMGKGYQLRKKSFLSEALEASDDREAVQLNTGVKGTEATRTLNQDDSNSVLEKLFGNVLTLSSTNSTNAEVQFLAMLKCVHHYFGLLSY